MSSDTFGVVLTRYCNVACAHCGSSSGPEHDTWLDLDELSDVLAAVARVGYRRVAFTGGEPMARRRHALAAVTMAHELGMASTVCTNAFWASDDSTARAVVDELLGAGVDRLHLSTDRWHAGRIEPGRVEAAARAGVAAGMSVQVAVPAGRADWAALELVGRFRSIPGVECLMHPAHPVGRGERLPIGALQPTPVGTGGCHLAGHLELDADGRISICPTSADFGERSVLRVLDTRDREAADRADVTAALEQALLRPVVQVIHRWGPVAIARLAGRPETARHDCHLCRSLHDDGQALADVWHRHGLDLDTPVALGELDAVLDRVADLLASPQGAEPTTTPVMVRC